MSSSASAAANSSASAAPPVSGPVLSWSRKEETSPYAYVFAVFKDPTYLLGALVAAFSLKATKTPNDVVLLATDIPEDMLTLASRMFDRIYQVPYLRLHCRPLRTEKQRQRYGSWMDVSCTKWNCLGLIAYRKVMFLDADKLVLASLDALFELPTPAGTFSSPQAHGYCQRGGMYNPYLELKEGDKVTERMVWEGLTGAKGPSFTVIGTAVVLSPSQEDYQRMIVMLGSYTEHQPLGSPMCNSSTDEQALARFYSLHLPGPNRSWTYVSQRHGWIVWQKDWLREREWPPTVLHYLGRKFWALDRHAWLDLEPLWSMIGSMIESWPVETERPALRKLYGEQLEKPAQPGCFYCKLLAREDWARHSFMVGSQVSCSFYIAQFSLSGPHSILCHPRNADPRAADPRAADPRAAPRDDPRAADLPSTEPSKST